MDVLAYRHVLLYAHGLYILIYYGALNTKNICKMTITYFVILAFYLVIRFPIDLP